MSTFTLTFSLFRYNTLTLLFYAHVRPAQSSVLGSACDYSHVDEYTVLVARRALHHFAPNSYSLSDSTITSPSSAPLMPAISPLSSNSITSPFAAARSAASRPAYLRDKRASSSRRATRFAIMCGNESLQRELPSPRSISSHDCALVLSLLPKVQRSNVCRSACPAGPELFSPPSARDQDWIPPPSSAFVSSAGRILRGKTGWPALAGSFGALLPNLPCMPTNSAMKPRHSLALGILRSKTSHPKTMIVSSVRAAFQFASSALHRHMGAPGATLSARHVAS